MSLSPLYRVHGNSLVKLLASCKQAVQGKIRMNSLLQEKLCEVHTQAPPPSKDFHHLTITKTEVIWKSWRISFRPNQERFFPREVKKLHKDFLLDEQLHKFAVLQSFFGVTHLVAELPNLLSCAQMSIDLMVHKRSLTGNDLPSQEQVQNIFGNKMLEYVLNLCQGQYDFLIRMPDNLIIHILSFLTTEDIRQLSKTCKRFRQLCNTEEFWDRIKRLQDKYTLDVHTAILPAYKKPMNFRQRPGFLTPIQRRQTTFF